MHSFRSILRLAIALTLICIAETSFAQVTHTASDPCSAFHLQADKSFAFDVVAIKPGDPARRMLMVTANNHGMWGQQGTTISKLIEQAYGVAPYQVEGIPKPLQEQKFDINAKTLSGPNGTPVPAFDGKGDAKRLQSLLADRFGVQLGCRTGEHKTAILTLDPKHPAPPPSTVPPAEGRFREGSGYIGGKRVSFAHVVGLISYELQEKVEDNTGLKDSYDIEMHWTPRDQDPNAPDGITFEQALYDTFGVKIKNEMRPLAILVVKQAHAPDFD